MAAGDSGFTKFMEAFGTGIENHPIKITLLLLGLIVVGIVIYWVADNWQDIKDLGPIFTLGAKLTLFAVIAAALLGITVLAIGIVYKIYKFARGKNETDKEEADKKADADKAAVDNDPKSTDADKAAAAKAAEEAKANNQKNFDNANNALADAIPAVTSSVNAATENLQGGQGSTKVDIIGPDGTAQIDVENAEAQEFDNSLQNSIDSAGGVTGASSESDGGGGGDGGGD
jgi:pyruvate/2-oxoglutarate dehydrogenase complex dihydrolipoamide acyltransferase (E2) component